MRYVIILLALLFTATHGISQGTFTARQKALLDLYYAQALANSIDGSWIEAGSLPVTALEADVQDVITSAITNTAWIESNSNFVTVVNNELRLIFNTDWLSNPLWASWLSTNSYVKVETDPNSWYFATDNIAASTSTVQPRTISVSGTNLFVCVSNNWAGVGTNWMKTTMVNF